MSTLLQAITQIVCLAGSLTLFPGVASAQERTQPVAPRQEASAPLVVPALKTQGPAPASPGQPGNDIPAEEAAETKPALAEETPGSYLIREGDTLWDISASFFKDPFLWPFIWKANPGIANPDLIYAGGRLTIPSLSPIEHALTPEPPALAEHQAAVPEPAPPAEIPQKEAPAAAGVPPQQAVPEKKDLAAAGAPSPQTVPGEESDTLDERFLPLIDKYAMLSAGFVNNEETEDTIVGGLEKGKSIFGYDDVVYVSIHGAEKVSIGDKYLIFTSLHKVKHPKTGKNFGKLIKGLGVIQITAKDPAVNVLTARITISFDTIEKGHMLAPYQEPMLVFQSTEKRAKDISGYILEVTDQRSINGQTDIVYLDKGEADGVEPGDRFLVYVEPDKRSFPREVIGEVQVLLVKQHTSTALVRKSTEAMGIGSAIDLKK